MFSISCSLHGTRNPSPIGSIPYSEEKVKTKSGMERIKPPPELDIASPNLADEWQEWSEAWELYRISSGLDKKLRANNDHSEYTEKEGWASPENITECSS